ncbi:cytochrome d ubiquinol oxidase subunit II [Methylophaga sp.]|uniref:cytochrome d ubiquinol oxidase subunit II n=1 Tax=Methylophaga sp. TaxID=2024840 RepID=UPI003F69DF3A
MVLDYETLKLVWWLLMGVLLIGFVLTDGFDMGVGILLPFVGQSDEERRIMLNTVGPHWEGNQVWLVTAGGALFAAWPLVYAMAFSGFYLAMMLTLFALFLRPVGFDYRSKIDNPHWRRSWDWGLFVGSVVPPIIFGVAFGNLLLGVPFHFDEFMRPYYTGNFFQLLNPFALLAGIISLLMVIMHGAVWLQARTDAELKSRCTRMAMISALVLLVLFALAGIWVAKGIDGYIITLMPDAGSSFTPEMKQVQTQSGAWMNNYSLHPWTMWAPVLALLGMVGVYISSRADKSALAFISSSMALSAIILTAGFSMFPFVMPSSTDINSSLTLWDATSSELTLSIMFWVAMIFVPIILLYSFWTYRKMWRRLDLDFIRNNQHSTY